MSAPIQRYSTVRAAPMVGETQILPPTNGAVGKPAS
jgi:hypothetical protein